MSTTDPFVNGGEGLTLDSWSMVMGDRGLLARDRPATQVRWAGASGADLPRCRRPARDARMLSPGGSVSARSDNDVGEADLLSSAWSQACDRNHGGVNPIGARVPLPAVRQRAAAACLNWAAGKADPWAG